MQLVIFSSAFLSLLAYVIISRRPRFVGFSCLKPGGTVREQIVKIERQLAKGNDKLLREIRIFNHLRLVMPCRNGVPVVYAQYLGRLVLQPRWVLRETDGFLRLLYICAAANLYARTSDALVRRQLLKNCFYVFGMKDVVKTKLRCSLRQRSLSPFRQAAFKYLQGRFIFKENRLDRPSYTFYQMNGARVKHYADKVLPVECFETSAERFSYSIGADKLRYTLSHTADTFYAVGDGKAVGLYVPDKVTFGSSICEKGDELKIYVYAGPSAKKIFIIHGKTKADITATVARVKKMRGNLDYLLTSGEAREVSQLENLFRAAWGSRFVRGDGLKDKSAAACKLVPTLFLPTLVKTVENSDDFFAVVDSFKLFRRIAETGNRLNIVFLYSSMNDLCQEVIKTFASETEARDMIAAGVFLFFVDRVTADDKAVNYLSLMSEAKLPPSRRSGDAESDGAVELVAHISNSYPITHTVYVRNTVAKARSAKIRIPLDVGSDTEGLAFKTPAVCKQVGANCLATPLKTSARGFGYKLPAGAVVLDELGREIGEKETVCERVWVQCKVSLAALEEKVLGIIKGEGNFSRAERKQEFIGSLENIKVSDGVLSKLFAMRITEGQDEKLLCALKTAVKDFDRDVFFALLSKREGISSDVYAFLVERVLGIKLLRGKIQLMPAIAITGSFQLGFTYKGAPFSFCVTQRGGGFSVNYGGAEYKNFLQIAAK